MTDTADEQLNKILLFEKVFSFVSDPLLCAKINTHIDYTQLIGVMAAERI
jgi:hypothetical protein